MNTLQNLMARRRALMAGTATEAGESGFTLIELMVVVLIIAILMAIAIPTFLGSKTSAQNSAAQQDDTVVMTDAASVYANSQRYDQMCGAGGTLAKTESNITVEAAAFNSAASSNQVTAACSVAGNDTAVLLSTASVNGDCWMLWTDASNGTQFGVDTANKGTGNGCPAGDRPANATSGAAPVPAAGGTISWASQWNSLTG